jgi:hypothetical protein
MTKIITCLCVAIAACPLMAQNDATIVNDPTAHAWDLFIKLNTAVPNDPGGRVVWETWILGRTVFATPNQAPVWNPAGPARAEFEATPLQRDIREQLRTSGAKKRPQPKFDPAVGTGNETRMNKPAFDFIVGNDLYYAEGIEAFAKAGKKFDFPREAIEIKAQWRRLTAAQDPARYHTAKIQVNGQDQVWGLTALHITTKELPNWFWTTFEHKDNGGREDVLPDVKPQKQPASLAGTKWENYVLRGTQLDFTDSIGRPLRLASSQVEDGFQDTSSCITCHARATVNPQPPLLPDGIRTLDIFDPQSGNGFIGTPDPRVFLVPGSQKQLRFTQLDFVWSFFRAQRRAP